ncbi:hypothetical protein Agub_g2292, partial [Astrephomene gubernaculifera]
SGGLTYSASLKYKLACGAVVIVFQGRYSEFYYPALQPGTHLLSFPEAPRDQLLSHIAPRIKAAITRLETSPPPPQQQKHADTSPPQHGDTSPPPPASPLPPPASTPPHLALAAREFAVRQLSEAALGCYWYKALLAYGGLYFAESGAHVPKEVQLG